MGVTLCESRCRWLGGVLFPQRNKRVEEERAAQNAAEGAPYGRHHDPPQTHAHSVGHAGGSQFARKRAENVKMGTDPYDAPTQQEQGRGTAPYGADAGRKQGGGGVMGALGAKAAQDFQAAQGAVGKFAKNFNEQSEKSTGAYGRQQPGVGISATGNERARQPSYLCLLTNVSNACQGLRHVFAVV